MLKQSIEIYRKDLVILQQTIEKINEKRLELEKIEEQKREAEKLRGEAQASVNNLLADAGEREERIVSLQLLEESLRRQIKYLDGLLERKELELLSKKTLTDAEKIKLDYIKSIRDKSSIELKNIREDIVKESEVKSVRGVEVRTEEDRLNQIKRETADMLDKVQSESAALDAKRSALRKEEEALNTIKKDFNIKRQRLQKFADKNKIQIKL